MLLPRGGEGIKVVYPFEVLLKIMNFLSEVRDGKKYPVPNALQVNLVGL